MSESRTRASTLLEAAAAAGGIRALARRLRVPTKQLGSWMEGDAEAPDPVILRAVYLLQHALETPDNAAAEAGRPAVAARLT